MKAWQKQVIQFGIPILLDWVKSLFNKEKKKNNAKIKFFEDLAKIAIQNHEFDRYLEIMEELKKYKEK